MSEIIWLYLKNQFFKEFFLINIKGYCERLLASLHFFHCTYSPCVCCVIRLFLSPIYTALHLMSGHI